MVLTRWLAHATAVVVLLSSLVTAAPATAAPADDLTAQLTTYLATQPGAYTVSVHELGPDGISVGINDHSRIEPASVIKLFYAWAALRRVDQGSLRLDQAMANGLSWDRCMKMMITISDNDCSADIRVALGNRTLNTLFAASGYPDTFIRLTSAGAYDGKRTSAADTTLLLTRLDEGTLLSPASTAYFHQLLKDQVWRTRINLGVPRGIRVENKGGELAVASGMTESDAAIVRGPHSTYVLTVYGRNNATKPAISGISKIVYEFLQGEPVTDPAWFSNFSYTAASAIPVRTSPGGRVKYNVTRGTILRPFTSVRNWVEVKATGKPHGWVKFVQLQLRNEYRWQ